jgi:hypothetical protein
MNSVKPARTTEKNRGFLQILFAAPAVKYSVTFAAGVFLTLSIVNSNQISDRAFDDVTGLVGTVAEPIDSAVASSVSVTKPDLAGTVSLRSKDSMLILDFDLVAKNHIDIEANYTDRSIWFNGFAQLESEGTTISAETGHIRMGMDGKRRYAVYLYNQSNRETTVSLRFLADGKVVHEASLDYTPAR